MKFTFQNLVEQLNSKEMRFAVLATSSPNGTPEAAVVGYAVKDDLSVIIATDNDTRKWKHLEQNNLVSLVFFSWHYTDWQIQYDGIAKLVTEGGEYTQCRDFFYPLNPTAQKFVSEKTVFAVIKPKWIRIMDISVAPPLVEEKTFPL